jgi:hypothetical protein
LFLEAWGRYTALILWPGDLTLGRALFSFSDAALVPVWHFVALGAVTLGLLVWSVTAWRRAGAVTVAWWSYAALLLPVSSIIWLDYDVLVSPRFLYIPMLAIAFMVAAGAARLRPWSKRWAQPLVILVVVVLGVRSFIRSYDFSSAQRFWRSEVTHNPRYTAAWAFFVARELKEGRPRGALNVAHAGFQALSSDQDIELARVGLIAPTLTAILSATPDLDRNTLRQVADFAKNVRELRPAQLNLPHLGLVLRLESSSVVGRALKGSRYRLLVLEADAHSRLGNRQRTRELLTPLLEECTKCWELFNAAMSIAARVDRLDLAATMVERARLVAPRNVAQEMREFLATAESLRARLAQQPGSKQRQVSYLAFIGAYARAYALARAEYERSPQPSLAKTVTELAVLAGDDQAAKQLLVQRFGPEKAPLYLQRLKELSGRSDPPAPAGHWTPKPQTLASATP